MQADQDQVWDIVERLRALSDDEREAELRRLLESDPTTAHEVQRLVAPPPTLFLERRHGFVEKMLSSVVPTEHATDLDIAAGTVLGDRYVVLERIGAGAMGTVYRGKHNQLESSVAIKILHSPVAATGESAERAVREARLASSVRHENVVTIHDVGVVEGRPYLVMDWVDGVDLQSWLDHAVTDDGFDRADLATKLRDFIEARSGQPCSGPLWDRPYAEIVSEVVKRVALAAHSAHACGMVHRDIAPKNVLLTAQGHPFLIDFGVAILASDPRSQQGAAGTLPYMAPEQLELGVAARKAPVDVYSLGATLYHLLAGRPPFAGEGFEILDAIRHALPPRLRSLRPEVPRDLDAICEGALEKRAAQRYASASELAADLTAFLDRRPIARRPPGPIGRLARFCQRRPALAAALLIGCALVVVSSALGYSFWKEHQARERVARRERFAESFSRLPPVSTLEADARYASEPRLSPADARLGPVWKELVALEPDAPLLRWYRVNWASQWGELATVDEEIAELGRRGLASPLVLALGELLKSPDAVVRNQLAEPAGLPAPESAFDHAVLAHLAIRRRESKVAWNELSLAITADPDSWLYRDLRALAGLDEVSGDLYVEDAALVEAALGRPTCRTLHVRAYLVQYKDPTRATELWQRSLDLCGVEQHQALHGIGALVCEGGKKYDEAVALLRRADAALPGSWNTTIYLSRCYERRGNFHEAKEQLAAGFRNLPKGSPSWGFKPREDLLSESANLEMAWALELVGGEQFSDADFHVQEAERLAADLAESSDTRAIRSEIAATRTFVDFAAQKMTAEDAIEQVRKARLDFATSRCEKKECADSSLIQALLGHLLVRSGLGSRSEVETLFTLSGLGLNEEKK